MTGQELRFVTCFGCQKELKKGDPVIRLTMDQFAEWQGEEPLGLGDLLGPIIICEGCTQHGDSPWSLEPLDG